MIYTYGLSPFSTEALNFLDETGCADAGGIWQGEGTDCGDVDCSGTGPCCFASTGGCVQLVPGDCLLAGGIPGTAGETCEDFICFPEGACCLPDGSCIDGVSPEECEASQGVFQGDGTNCAAIDCPEPVGAACFSNGFCLELTEAALMELTRTLHHPDHRRGLYELRMSQVRARTRGQAPACTRRASTQAPSRAARGPPPISAQPPRARPRRIARSCAMVWPARRVTWGLGGGRAS